ncbi:MAG TPA: NUMOD3 domain-containing DNA-binding protein [Terriglobales bacterium]|nr:NUMOD3 domain-containing DNA-binding protein [Terriglobales bacterium]
MYEHWRSDVGACFYVGKGKKKRAYDTSKRNSRYKRIAEKLRRSGGTIEIVFISENLTEEAAFELEKARISYWRNAGVGLANLTDGGEGRSGYITPPEVKKKIAKAHAGKTLSFEHRSKLSEAQRRRFADPEERERISRLHTGRVWSREIVEKRAKQLRGRKMSDEFKAKAAHSRKGKKHTLCAIEKMRAAQLGKKPSLETIIKMRRAAPQKRSVRCLTTGEVFMSASEAARVLSLTPAHISSVCRGVRKTTGGLRFAYVNSTCA